MIASASPNGIARPSCLDTAYYIAQLSAELRDLCEGPRLRDLRYILDMARIEAEREVKRSVIIQETTMKTGH